jgi:hypothetical protein
LSHAFAILVLHCLSAHGHGPRLHFKWQTPLPHSNRAVSSKRNARESMTLSVRGPIGSNCLNYFTS